MKTRKSEKKSGFSLLELLAVVTILGIIASIIVPRVSVSSQRARDEVQRHQIATLNAAVERFFVNEGSFPATLDLLVTTDSDPNAAGVQSYVPDGIPTPAGDPSATYGLDANSRIVVNAGTP